MSKSSEQCQYEFAPGVRCQMEAGHEQPYYPYLDHGQWGEYSDILSRGSAHQVHADPPQLPPPDERTGREPKGGMSSWPRFYIRGATPEPDDSTNGGNL